jgi:Domain of unknown function (DUF4157)
MHTAFSPFNSSLQWLQSTPQAVAKVEPPALQAPHSQACACGGHCQRCQKGSQAWQQGTQGSAQELPHRQTIERLLKRDLRSIRAYTGGGAQQANDSLGAEAFTVGNQIIFSQAQPDLDTAIHETLHSLQQGMQAAPLQSALPILDSHHPAELAAGTMRGPADTSSPPLAPQVAMKPKAKATQSWPLLKTQGGTKNAQLDPNMVLDILQSIPTGNNQFSYQVQILSATDPQDVGKIGYVAGHVLTLLPEEPAAKNEGTPAEKPPADTSLPRISFQFIATPGEFTPILQPPRQWLTPFPQKDAGGKGPLGFGTPSWQPGNISQDVRWGLPPTQRGLEAEDLFQQQNPSLLRLTPGFTGFDYWEGGEQTDLTGSTTRYKGRKTPVATGLSIIGGTGVSLKTMENGGAYYQSEDNFRKSLREYFDGAAWKNVTVGYDPVAQKDVKTVGLNAMTPKGLWRMEGTNPDRQEVHIIFEKALTVDQQRWLDDERKEAEFRWTDPGQLSKLHVKLYAPQRATTAPPSHVRTLAGAPGTAYVPSQPEVSSYNKRQNIGDAAQGGLFLLDLLQSAIGNAIQGHEAEAAWKQAQAGLQQALEAAPGQGATVWFKYSESIDPTGDSMLHPVPKFEGIQWELGYEMSPKNIATATPRLVRSFSKKIWVPPVKMAGDQAESQRMAKKLWKLLSLIQDRIDRSGSLRSKVNRLLLGGQGQLDTHMLDAPRAHLTSAEKAIAENRLADAEASLNKAADLLEQARKDYLHYAEGH